MADRSADPTPLDSARTKLRRAEEHQAVASRNFQRWLRQHPNPYTTKAEFDLPAGCVWIKVETVERPPDELSVLLGEVLQSARACLDHVAWQVVQHGTKPHLTKRDQHRVQFPIYDTRQEFDAQVAGRLPGAGSAEAAIVRRWQPYHRRTAAIEHPLAVLRDLSNADKHRHIPLVVWSPHTMSMEIDEWAEGCEPVGFYDGPDLGKPLTVGARLGYVRLRTPAECRCGIHVKAHSEISVALENGWRLDAVMHVVISAVRALIDEIGRVL